MYIMDLNTLVSGNQSIKVIPEVEDYLRSFGFNVDLSKNDVAWLDHLKSTWKTWKNSAAVVEHVETFFVSLEDPFRVALAMVIKCDEFKDSKPKSLPYFIIETLYKWTVKHGKIPDNDVKLPAFRTAIQQRNHNFQALVIKTYNISTIKSQVLPIVNDMIRNGNHKQASNIVIATELYDEIPVEELLFPLLLQDKANMVDEYLMQCPNHIMPFLLFLDNLLDKSFNLHEFIQSYLEDHKIADIKYDKLHYKPLGKLVARLCNKFKIPISSCKNLSKNRTTGGLRYLIYQRYQEHNVSLTVWDDLVKDALEQNSDSAIEFIDTLIDYDKKEALKWAEYLRIPENTYPSVLKELMLSNSDCTENWDEEPSTSQSFYKLSIQKHQIKIIDSTEKFYDMLVSDLLSCAAIGIDCEWKPTFGTSQSQVALIQISTKTSVYLIDTLVLNKKEFSSFWYMFNKSLMDNAEIIKVGFGLEQDLKEIKASIVGLQNIKVKGEGLLDLSLLWKGLLNAGIVLPNTNNSGGISLSCVVQSCFGLPLAKSEQCSNWELRPLRDTQIEYAALDAYVLIEIYLYLQHTCQSQGLNFDEICNDIMTESKQKNTKKLKVADRLKFFLTADTKQLKQIHEVKFLVDPLLSNLLVYLRYVGIDAEMIKSERLWHDIIKLAISDDRFILLGKLKITSDRNYPQSSILEVKGDDVREQLTKILSHFRIDLKIETLNKTLVRCLNCNESDLRIFNKKDVECSKEDFERRKNNRYELNNFYNDDECYDNFLSDSDDCDYDILSPVEANTNNSYKFSTKKGVSVASNDIQYIVNSGEDALLCECCGSLHKTEDLKPIIDLLRKVICTDT